MVVCCGLRREGRILNAPTGRRWQDAPGIPSRQDPRWFGGPARRVRPPQIGRLADSALGSDTGLPVLVLSGEGDRVEARETAAVGDDAGITCVLLLFRTQLRSCCRTSRRTPAIERYCSISIGCRGLRKNIGQGCRRRRSPQAAPASPSRPRAGPPLLGRELSPLNHLCEKCRLRARSNLLTASRTSAILISHDQPEWTGLLRYSTEFRAPTPEGWQGQGLGKSTRALIVAWLRPPAASGPRQLRQSLGGGRQQREGPLRSA